ncbi:MAG: hypothetical protein ACOY4U_01170 [Pseudomonadota bacterium]
MAILDVIRAAAASLEPDATTDLTQLPLEVLMNIEGYSASKFMQRITGAPAAVSIVTVQDIKPTVSSAGRGR